MALTIRQAAEMGSTWAQSVVQYAEAMATVTGEVMPQTVAECLDYLERSPVWVCPWCGEEPEDEDDADAVVYHVEDVHGEPMASIYAHAYNEYSQDLSDWYGGEGAS